MATNGAGPMADESVPITGAISADLDEHGRPEVPLVGDEITTLLKSLERKRATLAWKCSGLDAAGMQATVGVDALPPAGASSETRDRAGLVHVVEAGRPHGLLPFGFARHYEVVGGRRRLIKQIIDEQRAAVIREAARRVLEGEAPYAIARDFNARGVPAPRGGWWDLTRVKRIVTSPTVAGLRVHRGQVVGGGDWPAILDHRTWTGCRARLFDPARRPSHDHPHVKYLLTGIATCGICSARLKTVKNRGNRSYSCQTCFKVGIKVDTLDDYVTRLALKRLQRTDIINRRDVPSPPELSQSQIARSPPQTHNTRSGSSLWSGHRW